MAKTSAFEFSPELSVPFDHPPHGDTGHLENLNPKPPKLAISITCILAKCNKGR